MILNGKVAIVTGASKGIGAATTRAVGTSVATTVFEPWPSSETAAFVQFHSEPQPVVRRAVQSPSTFMRTGPGCPPPVEVSFGPFHLRMAQFLLLEGDKPVTVGSRALEIL